MCVTPNPADIKRTRTFVYATTLGDEPVHVCGYQNEAENIGWGGNCMFLNFAGTNLRMVHGPELTTRFMDDMTEDLPNLVSYKGARAVGMESFGPTRMSVERYGDYTVIIAQGPDDILSALDQVPAHHRPMRTRRLEEMIEFYMAWSPDHSFVLGCFDGTVKPKHPITVAYTPLNKGVLTLPGLDGHDGRVPTPGAPIHRDFRCAFAIQGRRLPHQVEYSDLVSGKPWAPSSVAGFADNRYDGPNGDYVVPVEALLDGLTGAALAGALVS